MGSLNGKVVMITGASGGLGQAVTKAFSQAGAKVMVVGREFPGKLPEGLLGISADVTDEVEVQRLMKEAVQKTTRIDCLINLVGGFAMGRLAETDASAWSRMLSLNLTSAFLLSREATRLMSKQGAGRIIHMAAQAAVEPFSGAGAYIVSKSGLLALIKVLALELAGSGVKVNGVLPSTIDTPANRESMPDADPNQWVKPEAIAALLVFLASDEAEALNGALIPIGAA
ncbi:SDR family NAD(P)-dependent oxidoreductase [Nitrospira sp. T9]|uniref:SDR family NAD(P)-dependent oxidoreductase n=1 Tax=unclassified Nitrospira TaxID=2652172 RepID=UPI003F9A1D10